MTGTALRRLRVAYATMSGDDFRHPAYRRRFAFYAKARGIPLVAANVRERYDVVVVHHSADLTLWRSYEGGRIVFDYNDSYLREPRFSPKRLLRGLAKFASGNTRHPIWSYTQAYRDTMARAHAVVCSTRAQQADVAALCRNVHEILDFWSDDDGVVKVRYEAGVPFHMVWEGFPSFGGFVQLQGPLGEFSRRHAAQLHLVTNVVGARFLNTVWPRHTITYAKSVIPRPDVFLYEWNLKFVSRIITACDLALIPIDMRSPFDVAKPANRLLQFWRIGMPVLTSRTPEYARMAEMAGIESTCDTPAEWEAALERYAGDEERRRADATAGKALVDRCFSNDALLRLWDAVLESVV